MVPPPPPHAPVWRATSTATVDQSDVCAMCSLHSPTHETPSGRQQPRMHTISSQLAGRGNHAAPSGQERVLHLRGGRPGLGVGACQQPHPISASLTYTRSSVRRSFATRLPTNGCTTCMQSRWMARDAPFVATKDARTTYYYSGRQGARRCHHPLRSATIQTGGSIETRAAATCM